MERLAMNQLLEQWKLWEQQLLEVDTRISSRFLANRDAQLLATIPGVNAFIALAIACRIAPIERFPHGRSLANFLGLTPGCRSSGETERPGSITKVGSRMVRSLIAQVILHLLRKDGAVRTWYQRIKRRRGSRIARVAVMRRTAAIMQRMLSKGEPWRAERVDSATSETDDKPRRVQPRRRQKTVPSALMEGRTESSISSTGSSSLPASGEVARCQA